MESLEHLRKLLDNLEDLRMIVKTMKALSAASIRQYDQAVTALSGYYRTVELGLHVLMRHQPLPPPARHRSSSGSAAIVFGSDHGLCGRFNEEIVSHAKEAIQATGGDDVFLIAVGARVASAFTDWHQADVELETPAFAPRIKDTVDEILLTIDKWRGGHPDDPVYLYYNRRTSQRGYEPGGLRLLPVDLRAFAELREEPWPSRSLPMFTMNPEMLATSLIRQYLFVSLFRACAESQASEHASRLAAMQAAEKNLGDRFEEVTREFRRSRQTVITSELLDVVSGYETLRFDQ